VDAAGTGGTTPLDPRAINTTANPVPTTVQGTPNVAAANAPSSPVPVRDVGNPAKQAFQKRLVLGVAHRTPAMHSN
jgi:hypothetical protein